jgi:DNA adenine methylase
VQYLGGKTRIAKQLAELIDSVREPGQWVWDPFCGGLSMSVALSKKGPVWSTDINPALIALYKAVQSGWQPPSEVNEETWRAAKALPDSNPLKAFCGFGCSFGGRYFEGYARSSDRANYAATSKRVVERDCAEALVFACLNFCTVEPQPIEAVLYLDPPYAKTKGYSRTIAFDSALFFAQAMRWAAFTHVFISEYACPVGVCVFETEKRKTIAGGQGGGRVGLERLFYIPKGTRS